MAVKMGSINTLEVLREADISFILTDQVEEFFLHKKDATIPLNPGEKIDVFLYYDGQRRKTATMTFPKVDTSTATFCKVIDVNSRLGVFLEVGISKDLLLSRDDLPFTKSEWPIVGDQMFVKMRASKNQITARIINRYDIPSYLRPDTELIEGEFYKAIVVFFAEEGVVLITKEGHNIFVYFKHLRKNHRLGEEVEVKIINVKTGFNYNGTLIAQKELMIGEDAQAIKTYLDNHKGVMNITDKSTPELIYEVFKMSKSAFKRAVGSLYKEKLVTLNADNVELKQEEKIETPVVDTIESDKEEQIVTLKTDSVE